MSCSVTELIDPKTQPSATAFAWCQVKFCFCKYMIISRSLGGQTVGEDDGEGVLVGDGVAAVGSGVTAGSGTGGSVGTTGNGVGGGSTGGGEYGARVG